MSKKVTALAELDRDLADRAEEISGTINLALNLNIALRALHAACLAEALTLSLPEAIAVAQGIRLSQEVLLLEAQVKMQIGVNPMHFQRSLNNPQRKSGTICEMPNVLECPEQEIFSIRHYDGAKPAGVKGETTDCMQVEWYYHDDRVLELQ